MIHPMRTPPPASILAVVSLLAGAARADAPWKTVSSRAGLQVERRDVADSSMPEVRVTVHSALPAWRVAAAVWAERDGEFARKSSKKRVILRETADERVVYEHVRTPVVSDRDYTVRLRRTGDGRTAPFHLDFTLANDSGPPPEHGVVRLPRLHGTWSVVPAGDGGCDIVYVVHSEPGGGVPAFLVRGAFIDAARDLVYEVLRWADSH
jgi:hypothetical protein